MTRTALVGVALLALMPARASGQPVALTHAQLLKYTATPTVSAKQSGNWSDAATWGGTVPGARAKVTIPAGMVVTVDSESSVAYDWIRVDGTLKFKTDVSTQLIAETIVSPGRFEMGTAEAPILAGVTARLVFRSSGTPFDHAADPLELTRGLIAMSPVSIYGAPKQAWLPLTTVPAAGATSLAVDGDPTGWAVGDEILVAQTVWGQDEVVKVTAIAGRTVSIAPALKHARIIPEAGLKVHVGNLTRSVTIQTDPTQAGNLVLQGHVMLMGGGHQIHYVAVRDTGRTTVKPLTDPKINADGTRDPQLMPNCGVTTENVRGRYSFHFHNPGIESPLSVVEGLVIRVARNKGLKVGVQNHSAYVSVRRSIVHQVDGSGLFAEEGDERGEFRENFIVHSNGGGQLIPQPRFPCLQNNHRVIADSRRHDFGGAGNGIWLQGKDLPVIGNILVGHHSTGIEKTGGPLDRFVPNTFHVMFPARLLRDGDAWLRTSGTYPADGLIELDEPISLWADNIVYAVGGPSGNTREGAAYRIGTGLHNLPTRPKEQLQRNVAWNVPHCLSAAYSSRAEVTDLTCVAGTLHPVLADPRVIGKRRGISVAAQGGQNWDFVRVRLDGFTAGSEVNVGPGSTFQQVTINGQPYTPPVLAVAPAKTAPAPSPVLLLFDELSMTGSVVTTLKAHFVEVLLDGMPLAQGWSAPLDFRLRVSPRPGRHVLEAFVTPHTGPPVKETVFFTVRR